jgi:hypothetical protein
MNELATSTGYPKDEFPASSLDSATAFFHSVARQHLLHLRTQRNVVDDEADVRKRFIARQQFNRLIPKYCMDDVGPFKVFSDDMLPANMLIDPNTLLITAVYDFEFTNSMPAQFTYDPPWWLLLRGPDMWFRKYDMNEFLARYVPRMEQFLRALQRVEAKPALARSVEQPCLSTCTRNSWKTGHFWFNYAGRTSLDVDDIYWHALHDEADGDIGLLDEAKLAEMELLVQTKMEQRKAYEEECAVCFPED